jgi:tetratricopeptide (TPR) repeat protein
MKDDKKVSRQINRLTLDIEQLELQRLDEAVHSELADYYFERAELYFKSENFEWAIEDYNQCLDLNPYFYEADMGREMVYMAMKSAVAA